MIARTSALSAHETDTGLGRTRRRIAAAAALAGSIAALTIALADPGSPITISHVDSPDPIASGAEITYTINIVNTGGAKITNVVLSDQLNGVGGIGVPPKLVLTSTRGSCQQTVSLVTCNAGTIPGNGTWVVTIRGIVTAANGTTLNNTVSVSGTKSAQNFTTTATATTLVNGGGGSPHPDLTIAKTGPTSVVKASPMTYTLTINNLGTANATDIKVSDTLPLGMSGVSNIGTSLFVCTNDELAPPFVGAPITVTCHGGAVNQGANASITINATSPPTVGTITNTAAVDPDNTIEEGNELNNSSALVNTEVHDPVGGGLLSIDKTDKDEAAPVWDDGAGPDPVTPGQQITYKILVTNTSAFRADDVMVVDGTQGLEAATVQASQIVTGGAIGTFGGCTVEAPQARCTIRSLDPGGTLLMTVSGQVVASAGSTIINTATVTGNIKNAGTTNTDTELTTVRPSVDLTVTKADAPDPVCAASWPTTTANGGAIPAPTSPPLLGPPVCLGGLVYSFVLGNSGINPASNVVLRDPLPAGMKFDHYTDPGGVFPAGGCTSGAGNVVTCIGGTLPANSTRTITFVVAAPPGVGPISNTVTIDPANAIFEADETNNTATQGTQVATGVDLTILKFDNVNLLTMTPLPGFDPIATSGTQTYTILVDNIGPQDVSNIHVRDLLPANTILRSAQGDHGFTCSQNGNVVDCMGGSLPGTNREFYTAPPAGAQHATIIIKVFAQPIVGTMHNEVRVDPLNQIPEINEDNNIAVQDTIVDNGGAGNGAFNEFTIDKTQVSPNASNTARNAIVTYQILLTNDGTDPATGITVRDFLPAGSRYIEAVDDSTPSSHFLCTENGGVINCVGGEMSAGGTAKIKVKIFAPDVPGTYTNQAIVDPENTKPEGNEFNNQDTQQTVVKDGGEGAFNDLTIEKTPKGTTIRPNDVITYSLKVTNTGTNPALNVTVRDVLPAEGTFVSADDVTGPPVQGAFTCTGAGGVVNCSGGTLDGTDNLLTNPDVLNVRTIEVKVRAPNKNTTLFNQAFVDPDNTIPEGNEINNSDTATTTVASVINLKIEKHGPTQSSQSQVSKYELKVTNEEPGGAGTGQDAFGVKVVDQLPVGLIPLAVTAEPNFGCTVSENPINLVECIGDLGKGKTVAITVDIFQTAEGGRSLDNEACVDPDDTIEESNETDNCSTASTSTTGEQPKLKPDLVVVKTVSPSGPVTTGTLLVYTVTVMNAGTANAKGPLTLTDTLPDHVTFVNTDTTDLWTCTHAAGVITCHEPPQPNGGNGLAVGASATITINATYDGGATAPLVNTATVAPAEVDPGPDDSHENETNTQNNTAIAKNSVGGSGVDLVLSTIVDNPDPVQNGQTLTYTVVVVNGGSEDTANTGNQVVVRLDAPQTGTVFLSAAGSNGFNCDAPNANDQIICRGDLPAGGDTTITAKFTVTAGAPFDLNLTATVDPDNTIPETIEVVNNTQTEVTTVFGDACPGPPCIDLVAAQLVGTPDPYPNNGTVTMSFTLVNIGDTSTSLDPDPTHGEPLLEFDVFGVHTSATRTVTPTVLGTVTCQDGTNNNTVLLTDCFGNLGPGQAVTVTVVFTGVTSDVVLAIGRGDPAFKVSEFLENNNTIALIVNKQ
jgi:uncharacterized repeat protein (TIGR01451 family)